MFDRCILLLDIACSTDNMRKYSNTQIRGNHNDNHDNDDDKNNDNIILYPWCVNKDMILMLIVFVVTLTFFLLLLFFKLHFVKLKK